MEGVLRKAVAKMLPLIRFKEFGGEWKPVRLADVTEKINSGVTPLGGSKVYSDNGVLFIRSQNVNDDELRLNDIAFIPEALHADMSNSFVLPNDILLNITGASIGRSCVVPQSIDKANVNQHVCIIRMVQAHSPRFIQALLSSHHGQKLIHEGEAGGGREGLSFKSIGAFQFTVPALPEQQKIAAFLGAVDRKIHQLKRKQALLEQYKKGVVQQLFSQELRFKRKDGQEYPDWEEVALGELFERVRRKNVENNQNVLTISAQQGLISQGKYFNKSVSAANITGYYLLHQGEFAYNKSYSNGYPMGATKRLNRYDQGVVSPLYICFGLVTPDSPDFYEQYFESGLMNTELEAITQEGARNHGMLNISIPGFFTDITIPRPCLEEQSRIAGFLMDLDAKVAGVAQAVAVAQKWKKGLLQQMFV